MHADSLFNIQCCSILQTWKHKSDESETLVNVRDRGGSWRINTCLQAVFVQFELLFRSKTSSFYSSLVCNEFVKEVMNNNIVKSNFTSLCESSATPIKKEIGHNLLEYIIVLYFRVRTF